MNLSYPLLEQWIETFEPTGRSHVHTEKNISWLSPYARPYGIRMDIESKPPSITIEFNFESPEYNYPERQLDNIELPNVYVTISQAVRRVERIRIVGSDDPAILPIIAERLDSAAESIKRLGEKLSHKLVAEIIRRLPELEQMQNKSS